jgi:putative tryptophan/tyrosine transport system substrate-binding protein
VCYAFGWEAREALAVKRRAFITLLGGAAVAWPLKARAQQGPVIGFLGSASPASFAERLQAFRRGLAEAGFVEGRNVEIEFRWANDQLDRLPVLAEDLVRRRVNIIAAPGNTAAAMAAKAATTTTPIVFYIAGDPIELGLVAGLSRPGGNLTGITNLQVELGPKQVELLHGILPTAHSFALLVNPTNRGVADSMVGAVEGAARSRGLQLHVHFASAERDFKAVFQQAKQREASALIISPDPFFTSHIEQLASLAMQHRLPAVYPFREFVTAGGLMSYGASNTEAYYLAGIYTGRILRGEKASELPIQQATKIELVINLKTANALGLTVPTPLLGRADQVIE